MAKFVLTTWAACLARQKPVSTSANPACMKMTDRADDHPQHVEAPGQRGHRVGILGEGHAAGRGS